MKKVLRYKENSHDAVLIHVNNNLFANHLLLKRELGPRHL